MSYSNSASEQSGYALLVVLSALAILTALYAISSRLSLSASLRGGSEVRLAENGFENMETLLAAIQNLDKGNSLAGQAVVSVNGSDKAINIVDVGGLVDLNSASPQLIDTLFRHLDMEHDAAERFREWRRTPYRLQRISDLKWIAGATPQTIALMKTVATVHSGRRGVNLENAPNSLVELLGEATLTQFATAPSGSNYAVFDGTNGTRIGVIHLRPGDATPKFLLVE